MNHASRLHTLAQRERDALRHFRREYAKYLLLHLVLSPYLVIKGWARARKRDYAKNIWRRLIPIELLSVPKGAHAVYGLGIGEAQKAVGFLKLLEKRRSISGYVFCETDAGLSLRHGVRMVAAPFNNPISAYLALLISRPKAVWIVENINHHHFKAIAAILRIPTIVFNVQNSIEYDLRSSHARWRIPLIGLYAVQSDELAGRLSAFTGQFSLVETTGPLAFGTMPPTQEIDLPRSPIVIAGSTWKTDETVVLDAFRALQKTFPAALLVLAPRDLTRVEEIRSSLEAGRWSFIDRSSGKATENAEVLLLDTMGDLQMLYGLADLAVVGGTFEESAGGHTPLEALAHGVPTSCGPFYSNQKEIIEKLLARDLIVKVQTPEQLSNAWKYQLSNVNREHLTARFNEYVEQVEQRTLQFFDSIVGTGSQHS